MCEHFSGNTSRTQAGGYKRVAGVIRLCFSLQKIQAATLKKHLRNCETSPAGMSADRLTVI